MVLFVVRSFGFRRSLKMCVCVFVPFNGISNVNSNSISLFLFLFLHLQHLQAFTSIGYFRPGKNEKEEQQHYIDEAGDHLFVCLLFARRAYKR